MPQRPFVVRFEAESAVRLDDSQGTCTRPVSSATPMRTRLKSCSICSPGVGRLASRWRA